MPSLFESGSLHADSVNDTWLEFTNVAASRPADAGRTPSGAEPVRSRMPAAEPASTSPAPTVTRAVTRRLLPVHLKPRIPEPPRSDAGVSASAAPDGWAPPV